MRVGGIDYSSRFVDLVTVPYDGPGAPVWHRFPLAGADAFDRARSVAQAVPGPTSVLWDDLVAVGIEHPAGKHGTGPLLRIQGAILTRIPPHMLVEPLPPGKWRKLVGLAGNASKEDVRIHALAQIRDFSDGNWRAASYDATDAYCIAVATLRLLDREKAA